MYDNRMNLLERAKQAEAIKAQVWKLYKELVPKRRTLTEIADQTGITKSRVHQIIQEKKKEKAK